MQGVTPTEYVWKYNPLSGIPAGAQQNYGATIDWILPGGSVMRPYAEQIQRRTLSPEFTARVTARFEAESDQQPYANTHESNYIAASALDSGYPKSGLYPLDPHGRQRLQLAGGQLPVTDIPLSRHITEGKMQLSGGLTTEGRQQLAGGAHWPRIRGANQGLHRPPRWAGIGLTGNGLADRPEMTSDAYKYFLRTQGPSQLVHVPGTYSGREFMTTFVPAINRHPFDSSNPGEFPAQYSAIYKGRTAFEDQFWDW